MRVELSRKHFPHSGHLWGRSVPRRRLLKAEPKAKALPQSWQRLWLSKLRGGNFLKPRWPDLPCRLPDVFLGWFSGFWGPSLGFVPSALVGLVPLGFPAGVPSASTFSSSPGGGSSSSFSLNNPSSTGKKGGEDPAPPLETHWLAAHIPPGIAAAVSDCFPISCTHQPMVLGLPKHAPGHHRHQPAARLVTYRTPTPSFGVIRRRR